MCSRKPARKELPDCASSRRSSDVPATGDREAHITLLEAHRTFTGVARAIGLSRSAVSRRMRYLGISSPVRGRPKGYPKSGGKPRVEDEPAMARPLMTDRQIKRVYDGRRYEDG